MCGCRAGSSPRVHQRRELPDVVVAGLVRDAEPRVDVQRVGEIDHHLDRYARRAGVIEVADVRARSAHSTTGEPLVAPQSMKRSSENGAMRLR